MNRFFILFLFLISGQSFAESIFRVNIETVLRNTVDDGLVLTSEYHFSRTALSSEIIREEIYEKIFLEMSAKFAAIGAKPSPGDIVTIEGLAIDERFSPTEKILFPTLEVKLGEKKFFTLRLSTERALDVSITPKMETYESP